MQPDILQETSITATVAHLVLQLAVILFATKLGAELFERWLKLPSVLGELLAGVAIGPYALGGIDVPRLGRLFGDAAQAASPSAIPVSPELWSLAQIGAVVLLFAVGLETEFRLFLRYSGPAAAIAVGGIVLPFILGDLATVAFGLAHSYMDPTALFVGTIMTATSVGITARVLADLAQLDSPEGITVLAGAVIDDVLGIIVLAVVVSLSAQGEASLGEIGLVVGKALGFWVGLMVVGLLLSRWISSFLTAFRSAGASLALLMGIAFLAAGLAETFGLALIIGAYTIGLALSDTSVADTLREPIEAIYHLFVPVFFAVTGMLVDFSAMAPVALFGLAISGLAIVGKVAGCGLPVLALGFNLRGAARIGVGMMPRGEVALIIAGVGLSQGVIGVDVFGISIMMTFITTVLAPILLVPLFRGGPGRRA